MGMRINSEYLEKQALIRKALIEEGVSGETPKDILPNTAYPFCGASEAIYFKNARNFLKTSLAHRIIDGNQDIVV